MIVTANLRNCDANKSNLCFSQSVTRQALTDKMSLIVGNGRHVATRLYKDVAHGWIHAGWLCAWLETADEVRDDEKNCSWNSNTSSVIAFSWVLLPSLESSLTYIRQRDPGQSTVPTLVLKFSDLPYNFPFDILYLL